MLALFLIKVYVSYKKNWPSFRAIWKSRHRHWHRHFKFILPILLEKIEYYVQYASIFFLVQLVVNTSGLLSLERYLILSLKYACFKIYV